MIEAITTENVMAWRKGHVINDRVFNVACCTPGEEDEEIFSYLELIRKDGTRQFIYENEDGYARFEADFVKRRFTSYHEFWTAKEDAVEQRDLFSFRYYIRRPADSYCKASIKETEEQLTLAGCRQLNDRVTRFHYYDREPNDYLEESFDGISVN